MARHGGHHEAQKSTRTGSLDWSTSFFQLNSCKSMGVLPGWSSCGTSLWSFYAAVLRSASAVPRLHFVRRWPGYAAKFATRPLAHKRPEGRGCHGWIFGPGAAAERNIQSGVAPKEETMSKPFDATLKMLLEESPVDWPALAGHPEQTVEVIDADISTFTGATDKVLRVRGLPDWIMHFEFQSGPDATLPRRLHGYNALLEQRHDLLVRSVVVLLRRQADLANVTGVYERQFPNEPAYLAFRYQVLLVG